MPVLRLLFIVLVMLNLLALAAGRGWLGSSEQPGEPERITNQLNPERIVLEPRGSAPSAGASPARPDTPPPRAEAATPQRPTAPEPSALDTAAPPPPPEPEACIAYAALTGQQADTLESAALAQPVALRTERSEEHAPSGWWVRLPPAGGREGAERKVNELRALGVTDFFIIREPGPNQYAISLGLFKTETAAQQHLVFLQGKRVRGAMVAARDGVQHGVRIYGPSAALEQLAGDLVREMPGALRSECAQ